jgi:hypothetical protein
LSWRPLADRIRSAMPGEAASSRAVLHGDVMVMAMVMVMVVVMVMVIMRRGGAYRPLWSGRSRSARLHNRYLSTWLLPLALASSRGVRPKQSAACNKSVTTV